MLDSLGSAFFSRTEKSAFLGYDKMRRNQKITSDDLLWNRVLECPQINIKGMSFVNIRESKFDQGSGYFSDTAIEYIRGVWKKEKKVNEIRILLTHHNLLSVQSFSNLDEKRITYNTGSALNALFQFNCDIVINGHTHRSEIVEYT